MFKKIYLKKLIPMLLFTLILGRTLPSFSSADSNAGISVCSDLDTEYVFYD